MLREGETAGDPALVTRAGGGGFALVEALVAGALLGWILLVGLDFLVLEKRAEERLAAQRNAIRAIETVVEGIRVGVPDLEVGTFELGASDPSKGLQLRLVVENEMAMSDLFRVRVEARFTVRNEIFSRDLETLVWHPYP